MSPAVQTGPGRERPPSSVVVVGGSLAGVTVVDELRTRGFAGAITLVSDECEMPYDRPPLSKQYLTFDLTDESAALRLKDPTWYSDNAVDLRLGVRATGLRADGAAWRVTLDDGTSVRGDDVVVATGSRPRTLAGPAVDLDPVRVHYLRDLADATRLREAVGEAPGQLVVIGAGFIGLEVAGAAAKFGWNVTVVDQAERPLTRVLPPALADLCLRGRPDAGVRVECGMSVARLTEVGGVAVVALTDGRRIPADRVVVGIGAVPNTEWLDGSGLAVNDGVVCDQQGRTSLARVWAAGDVARWPNAVTGRYDRVEQWQAAKDQGRVVADALLDGDLAWDTPPYFWTELFGQRVQVVGRCDPDMDLHIPADGRQALAVVGKGELHGVVAINSPRWLALGKRQLIGRISFEEARVWADDLTSST